MGFFVTVYFNLPLPTTQRKYTNYLSLTIKGAEF